MSDEPKKRRWWMRPWVWWAMPAPLILYVALEPPITIWCNHHDCYYVAEDVYAPVAWAKDHSRAITDFFDWYDGSWDWQTENY